MMTGSVFITLIKVALTTSIKLKSLDLFLGFFLPCFIDLFGLTSRFFPQFFIAFGYLLLCAFDGVFCAYAS